MKPFFKLIPAVALAILVSSCGERKIDRKALVERNNPHVTEVNALHSLNLGNGAFTLTLDATGLQTFPEFYSKGLSLGTYSEWEWHNFPNVNDYQMEETFEDHPLPGHPHGIYSVQKGNAQTERQYDASAFIRANPQRLHLGNIGFDGMKPEEIADVDQTLDMYNGVLHSNFSWNGAPFSVTSVSGGDGDDVFAASISSDIPQAVAFRFPYPTGEHTDDASDWNSDDKHTTEIVESGAGSALVKRVVDDAVYYVAIGWSGKAALSQPSANKLLLTPEAGKWEFSVRFAPEAPQGKPSSFAAVAKSGKQMWNNYWKTTGVIDFSECTNEKAPLLEKRVVLSQYLERVQEAQSYPPAETGMTYSSWHGKYHLEMVMFHSFHYATWNKADLLRKQLAWYKTAMPGAKVIAERQGFGGIRWMKMTDPSAKEAPSDIGSYIIWQQPHPIYMAELIWRATKDKSLLEEYADMIEQTAQFMADFLTYDSEHDRYMIEGACAANESLNEKYTVNPSFELSYWHFGLSVAQQWRERLGKDRHPEWDDILAKLSPLASDPEGIYLPALKGPSVPDFETMTIPVVIAAPAQAGGYFNGQRGETTLRIYTEEDVKKMGRNMFYVRGTSTENLLAYGMLPMCRLFTQENMEKTADRAIENWGWRGGNWSWNYPSFAMNLTRCNRPEAAVRAITMDGRSDLLLPSGNNYRSETLRMYTPGNGGLLLAVGMMCAGWDGCEVENPGFPKDGTWNVRWEGLSPMP